MPQFETSVFVSEAIWTLVSFALLYMLLKWLVLPRLNKTLDARARQIASELEAARKHREDAEQLHREYEEKLRDIDREASAMFTEADRRIREHRGQLMEEWKQEMDRRKQQFHEDTEAAKRRALREIRQETASMVVDATEKTIHQHIAPEEAEQMVDEALGEIEDALKHKPGHQGLQSKR